MLLFIIEEDILTKDQFDFGIQKNFAQLQLSFMLIFRRRCESSQEDEVIGNKITSGKTVPDAIYQNIKDQEFSDQLNYFCVTEPTYSNLFGESKEETQIVYCELDLRNSKPVVKETEEETILYAEIAFSPSN